MAGENGYSGREQDAVLDPAQLAGLGVIPPGYRHVSKLVRPSTAIALPGGYLKWYDVHLADVEIPFRVREQARDFLRTEATAGRLNLRGELGFVILHRCGDAFYYLLVCTWRNCNEMWQTGYARDGEEPFALVKRTEEHVAMQCVWEMGATTHERTAWSHYLESERDEAAKRAYLADLFTGAV